MPMAPVTAVQGSAVLKVNVDRAAPYRIHGLQILVGGPNQTA
jgi:hypothetical protein